MQISARPTPYVMLMDTGFDVDDESALLVAAALHKRGTILVDTVVTTTDPSDKRALLTKGALTQLGLPNVAVAVGDNHRPEGFQPQEHRLRADFLADPSELKPDAQALLRDALERAEDHSLVLVVLAKMTDANQLLQGNEKLFQQKVKQVVLMGGVQQSSEQTDSSASEIQLHDGYMVANTQATNNRHDQPAANQLYQRLQELDIKCKVVTRSAATNTPISPDFFRDLALTGHPVANHLRTIEGDYLNGFWQAASQNQMGPGRDAEWFVKTFCKEGTRVEDITGDVRPYLKSRVLYDALAVVAGVDELAEQVFLPTPVTVQHTTHEVIGLSKAANGLRNPQVLANLLTELAHEAIS